MARPLAFDPKQKLHKAMMLFWRKGYEATSMQDLVDELAINRYSIYNTFGDKQALFALSLEYYQQRVFGYLLDALQPIDGGLVSLEHYLDTLANGLNSQKTVSGCLLQKSLLEGGIQDKQILQSARDSFMQLRDTFEKVIESARHQQQISDDVDSAALADYMLLQVQGLIALHGLSKAHSSQALKVLKQQIHLW